MIRTGAQQRESSGADVGELTILVPTTYIRPNVAALVLGIQRPGFSQPVNNR